VRIGIVSDIHGNVAGLAAAMELMCDAAELLCAGDIVEEYRFSNQAVALLRNRGARCALGNHNVGFLGPHGARARAAADRVEIVFEHVNDTVSTPRFRPATG
jgi:Calcineurin-like phosphoesterase superfamily domain